MPNEIHKATVMIGDTKVIFEGPRNFVESQVAKYLQNNPYIQVKSNDFDIPEEKAQSTKTEREIVQAKRPRGHSETVVVLAFALAQNGITEFTEEDIRRAYIRANVRPPKVVSQAIRDAKNLDDYVEPTGKRGVHRLSPHGDRTVRFDLPRRDDSTS